MPEDDEDDEEALPHSEAVDVFQEGLAMVVQDPLLCDLPIQVRDRSLGRGWAPVVPPAKDDSAHKPKVLGKGIQNTPSQRKS